jgi:hypothetical protein
MFQLDVRTGELRKAGVLVGLQGTIIGSTGGVA